MMVSLVLTLEFHRGRPSLTVFERVGLGSRLPVGVAESRVDDGEGEARPAGVYVDNREVNGLRGKELVVVDLLPLPGMPLLLFERSLPFLPGVEGSSPPMTPLMTTDDAGELPGVSIILPRVERSFETMLEIESRSCWFFLSVCASSILASSSIIISLRLSHFFCISE